MPTSLLIGRFLAAFVNGLFKFTKGQTATLVLSACALLYGGVHYSWSSKVFRNSLWDAVTPIVWMVCVFSICHVVIAALAVHKEIQKEPRQPIKSALVQPDGKPLEFAATEVPPYRLRLCMIAGTTMSLLVFLSFLAWYAAQAPKKSIEVRFEEPKPQTSDGPSDSPPVVPPKNPSENKAPAHKNIKPPPSTRKPTEEKPQQSADPPPIIDVRLVSQEQINSPLPQFPWALKVVLQTNVAIQPVSFLFECNGEIGQGEVSFGADEGLVSQWDRSGIVIGFPNRYLVSFASPGFYPDKPMILHLYSKSKISVVRWGQIPYRQSN
jgi:hypothetical protein